MSSVMDIQNRQGDRQLKSPNVWSWLRRLLLSSDRGLDDQCGRHPVAVVTAPPLVAMGFSEVRGSGSATARPQICAVSSGVILPFPIHGEALLVKLAEVLRHRVGDRGPEYDPLLLQMSRCPRSRLSIDEKAYIEFHDECCEYRAVIEASQETKVILETADFDALVDFVMQYVVGRLAEPAALEAAS